MRAFWFIVDVFYPALVTALVLAALLAHVWMHDIWVFEAR